MKHLLPLILLRKHFSAGNLSDLRVRKETINKLLIGLICLKIFCSKIKPIRKNKIYFWRMVTKLRMFSVTQESVTMSVGRDRKIRTALRTNQIARFVILPSKKEVKNYTQNWFSVQKILISIRTTLMVIVIIWILNQNMTFQKSYLTFHLSLNIARLRFWTGFELA